MAKARKKPKGKPERDEPREGRITMDIVVGRYDGGEQAMCWYYDLEDKPGPLERDLEVGGETVIEAHSDGAERVVCVSHQFDHGGHPATRSRAVGPIIRAGYGLSFGLQTSTARSGSCSLIGR